MFKKLRYLQYNFHKQLLNKQQNIKFSMLSNNSQQPSLHEKFKNLDYNDIKELYNKLVIDREILIAHEKIKIINNKINLIIYGCISLFSISMLYIGQPFIIKFLKK